MLEPGEEALEGGGSHDIAGWHGNSRPLQLAEARAFAADLLPVSQPDVFEPGDVRAGRGAGTGSRWSRLSEALLGLPCFVGTDSYSVVITEQVR